MGAKEVTAGAEWLDENFPGWEREIDLGILQLRDCQNCICGQSLAKFVTGHLFSGYDVALARVTGKSKTEDNIYDNRRTAVAWAEAHGFYCWTRAGEEEAEGLWVELLKERFNTGNLSDGR